MYKKIVLISSILILLLLNFAIYKNEMHIKNGKVVLLKLAPVDPRSLMQGDYMSLNFEISQEIWNILWKKRGKKSMYIDNGEGYIVVSLDKNKVASFVSIYNNQSLKSNEILLQYKARDNRVKFATDAFFFQEGKGKKYQKAKYGEFRVDKNGKMLLVCLRDEKLKKIE